MKALTQCCIARTEEWRRINPVLYKGVLGVEKRPDGSRRIKIGDGKRTWNDPELKPLDQRDIEGLSGELAARIAEAVDAEAQARQAADEAESQERQASDHALQEAIDAEAQARQQADEAEDIARQAADQALHEAIEAETQARQQGEKDTLEFALEAIAEHNTSDDTHADIREAITEGDAALQEQIKFLTAGSNFDEAIEMMEKLATGEALEEEVKAREEAYQGLRNVVDGIQAISFSGAFLTRRINGTTEIPKILFPHDIVFVSGKTLISDTEGSIGVYAGDVDSAIIRVITRTISPIGAGESMLLGVVQTNEELPLTVDDAVALWGRNPNINDYATVQADETMQFRRVEWYITGIHDGDCTWGNPVPINTGDYQQQSTAEDSGKVLIGGASAGTFGKSVPVDTQVTEEGEGIPSTKAVFQFAFLASHPVGSIYMTVDPANPGDTYGGEWEAWGAGRVPVGVAAAGTFNTVEKTGGSETHTLTKAQMPSHTHTQDPHTHSVKIYVGGGSGDRGIVRDGGGGWSCSEYPIVLENTTATNKNTGEGTSHNNLQPYITCYMWKRTG